MKEQHASAINQGQLFDAGKTVDLAGNDNGGKGMNSMHGLHEELGASRYI